MLKKNEIKPLRSVFYLIIHSSLFIDTLTIINYHFLLTTFLTISIMTKKEELCLILIK